jgi:hypothetical protein
MILRIRLEGLTIKLGEHEGDVVIPSVPDAICDLPDDPVGNDFSYRYQHFISYYPLESGFPFHGILIKLGIVGGVGFMQKKLIENRELDSVSAWIHFSSEGPGPDLIEAFHGGQEVPIRGSAGRIVERMGHRTEPESR